MPTPKAEKDCPDVQQYQQLASSLLSDADREALLRHLEGCDCCANRLSKLPQQDALAKLLRQKQTVAERGSRETIAALIDRLSKLRPGSVAGASGQQPAPVSSVPSLTRLFSCPACGKGMTIPDKLAGKQVKCPYCKQIVRIPAAVTPAPATTAEFQPGGKTSGPGQLEATVDLQPPRESDRRFLEFLRAAEAPDELGRLGSYRVLKVLGSGGMGVVFRAEDPQLLRPVALKAMQPALAASQSARQRFLREARAVAAIKHDHIVSVYQVGEDRGVPYLAMEFLEGEPLDERLHRQKKLPAAEVIRVGREVAVGLAAAHKRGLVHRDIKPANIWLEAETDRVKILDFGLARASTEGEQLTQFGAVVGTPGYMAPEQAQGKSVDPRCDLFSLGCVLYRMATGKQAFHGSDLVSTIMAVNTHHPPPPHKLDAALPPALSQLIMKLLAKEPEMRPPSAEAVVEALERIAREQVAPVHGVTPRPRKKWPIVAGAAATLLFGGVLLLWGVGVFKVKTRDGTIVLENLPPDATVLVDGGAVEVEWAEGKSARISVAPGKPHRLQIEKKGLRLFADAVEIDAGGVRTVSVRLEPNPTAQQEPAVLLPNRYRNKLGMEFVLVPKGRSWLGGGGGVPGKEKVEVAYDFYLGKYEVTQGEWQQVMGLNPSRFGAEPGAGITDRKRLPVEQVSWDDAQEFIKAVNEETEESGWVYRLPTEVEWEYACRGGPLANRHQSAFHFYLDEPTNTLLPGQACFFHADPRYQERTREVGSYKPNRLGLYDMHGNVIEWCDTARTWNDAAGKPFRAVRGGSYQTDPGGCQAAHHTEAGPSHRDCHFGLRLARVPINQKGK